MRDEIAEILETITAEGLPGPYDLDVALDAIITTCTDDLARSLRGLLEELNGPMMGYWTERVDDLVQDAQAALSKMED